MVSGNRTEGVIDGMDAVFSLAHRLTIHKKLHTGQPIAQAGTALLSLTLTRGSHFHRCWTAYLSTKPGDEDLGSLRSSSSSLVVRPSPSPLTISSPSKDHCRTSPAPYHPYSPVWDRASQGRYLTLPRRAVEEIPSAYQQYEGSE